MRSWTLFFAATTLLATGAFLGVSIAHRPEVIAKEGTEPTVSPTRLAYVNIATLLKDYQRANQSSQSIVDRRKVLVDEITDLRNEIARLNKNFVATIDETEKANLQEKMVELNRRIEDIDKSAQREMAALSDKLILDVYHDIEVCVAEIAKERDLDVVEIYPAMKPINAAMARVTLQTPSGYPIFLRKDLDLTDVVLKRLNQKNPSRTK